jgi:hypothetical protein
MRRSSLCIFRKNCRDFLVMTSCGTGRLLGLTFAILVAQSGASGASGATGTSAENRGMLGLRPPPIANAPIVGAAPTWYLLAMRPERDIEAITLDTFNEAVRSGSAGALIKFISRHPDHPLAEKARRMLEEGNYPPARKTPTEWVDSKVVEFDAARRAGPDALKEFIARYPGHPLAAEARRLLAR